MGITQYITLRTLPPSPLNFPQRYDFKGLTPINYMDKDLSPIFGLNSRFGAVLGRIRARLRTCFAHVPLNSLVYQRVLGCASRICLKTALRLCRPFAHQLLLSHWASCASVRGVTVGCDEESVGDKESMYAVVKPTSRKAREVGHPPASRLLYEGTIVSPHIAMVVSP
jgi:hypothetical protein